MCTDVIPFLSVSLMSRLKKEPPSYVLHRIVIMYYNNKVHAVLVIEDFIGFINNTLS